MTRAERILTALIALAVLVSPVFLGGVQGFRRDWTGEEPGAVERFLRADGGWWTLVILGAAIAERGDREEPAQVGKREKERRPGERHRRQSPRRRSTRKAARAMMPPQHANR